MALPRALVEAIAGIGSPTARSSRGFAAASEPSAQRANAAGPRQPGTRRLLAPFPSATAFLPGSPAGAPTGLAPSVPTGQPLLLPGPCLKPSPSPLISALCAASWPHPPTHIKATPAFLLILSFIIHFKSELIRGIKGPFSISSRALLSQPWPGLAGCAQQLSQDTDAKFQETESQNGALFLCKLPAKLR